MALQSTLEVATAVAPIVSSTEQATERRLAGTSSHKHPVKNASITGGPRRRLAFVPVPDLSWDVHFYMRDFLPFPLSSAHCLGLLILPPLK
jgi:hypothetical protein